MKLVQLSPTREKLLCIQLGDEEEVSPERVDVVEREPKPDGGGISQLAWLA